jgi:hypothetical protein
VGRRDAINAGSDHEQDAIDPTARVVSTDSVGTGLRIPRSLLARTVGADTKRLWNEAVRGRECLRTGATAKPASGSFSRLYLRVLALSAYRQAEIGRAPVVMR